MNACVYIYIQIHTHTHTHLIFFIHSSVDGHLSFLQVLTIMHSAAVNRRVHASFWIIVFSGDTWSSPSWLLPSWDSGSDSAFLYPQVGKILHLLWILKVLCFYLSCVTHQLVVCEGVIQPHFMQQGKSTTLKKKKIPLLISYTSNSQSHWWSGSSSTLHPISQHSPHPAFAHHASDPVASFLVPRTCQPLCHLWNALLILLIRLIHSQP